LEALAKQRGDIKTEIIVVDCVGTAVVELMNTCFPWMRLIEVPERQSIAQLRSIGIGEARGKIIAITEDHCIPAPDWCQTIIKVHAARAEPAIGGAVDNAATQRLIDWAVYFCEYSYFSSRVPHGPVDKLPAPNVSYKRAALEEMRDLWINGYQENLLHQQLAAQGYRLWSDPSLVVWHKKHFTLRSFGAERFHYGRWFAGTRGQIDPARRIFYLLVSPLLPALILVRLARRVYNEQRLWGLFIRSLPYISIFLVIWAAGEMSGYACGPGDSAFYLS
jgi:hypothetical protein